MLAGLNLAYLEPTWRELTSKLWRLQREQRSKGGLRPGDVKHQLRADRHLKTVERHLRLLEAHGLLERNRVKGRPRRGPGTRVRYWLVHALNLRPSGALAAAGGPQDPPGALEGALDAPAAPRGPPERTPEERAASAAAAREVTDRVKAMHQDH